MTVPQLEDGFLKLANEIVDALMRTNLSAYESRFLWCLFRKTYGWQKKEDWIAVSQIREMTGMHKAHISRTKSILLQRQIVTERGNKLSFNKNYMQWRELPKGATSHHPLKSLPKGVSPVTKGGISELPKGADTKDNITKDTFTKERPEERKTAELTETTWKEVVLENGWCDQGYADKTWEQSLLLSPSDREEFRRKSRVMITSAGHQRTRGLARKIFHEIAGFVNDFGAMKRTAYPTPEE